MSENKSVAVVNNASASSPMSVFSTVQSFELGQRMAQLLCRSDMVPEGYRNNLSNCTVALEMAQRVGASPLMVMQNLHVINGRPSWSSSFVIAALNSCGRFSPLRFKIEKLGKKEISYTYWEGPKGQRERKTGKLALDDLSCTASAVDKMTGEVLDGPPVTLEMAVREGWYTKNDSKWPTMPELMLRYRAAKFFGNLYAPDVLMGMKTEDEERDIIDVTPAPAAAPASPAAGQSAEDAAAKLNAEVRARGRKARTPTTIEGEATPAGEPADKPPETPAAPAAPAEGSEAPPTDEGDGISMF